MLQFEETDDRDRTGSADRSIRFRSDCDHLPRSDAQADLLQSTVRRAVRQSSPDQGRGQAHHQRQDRRQSAGPVQVQVGLGKVSGLLRQSLDATGNQHEPGHRPVEGPQRSDRGRAARSQAQPGLLRHRRQPGRQQHRARHLSPYHARPSAASICCARPSRRRSIPTPINTSSKVWRWTKARCSTPTMRFAAFGTRTNS